MDLSIIKPERRLSIVHISTLEKDGGAARVAWRLYNAQRKAGHQSYMIAGAKKTTDQNIHPLPLEIGPNVHTQCKNEGLLYYEIQSSHRLVDHPLIKNCDILHLHNLHGYYFNPFSLALLARLKPVIWTLHDMQSLTGHCAHSFDCEKWQAGCGACPYLAVYPTIPIDSTAMLWAHKKLIYDHTPFQLAIPSNWLKNKVARSILKDHAAQLIYNGVDSGIFKPYNKLQMRRQFNLPENAVIIGGVANGGALRNGWKGGIYTLEAIQALCQKIPDCFFLSIGAGGNSEHPHILNIPEVKDESDLARLYSTLDIYLMTSIAENCPLVILEALSCGIPVVAFATGGVPELVRNQQDGLVVQYRDIATLIRALIHLARSPNLMQEFSINARNRILSHFDHPLIARKYEILYHQYLNKFAVKNCTTKPLSWPHIPEIIKTDPFVRSLKSVENISNTRTETCAEPVSCVYPNIRSFVAPPK